jgi:hypothetical protein
MWNLSLEAAVKALRYFTLDSIDLASHATQDRLIRRYIP